jgi:uncharacterized YccA/Bax inhibitor family protein
MIASFVTLFGTWWKRHEHPANFILLGLFTACESILIGTVTSYYESRIVCQALLITVGVFVGLTLFTMQSKVSKYELRLCGDMVCLRMLTASHCALSGLLLVRLLIPRPPPLRRNHGSHLRRLRPNLPPVQQDR